MSTNYIVINSQDRSKGNSSDFTMNLKNPIRLNGRKKIKLKNIVMYNTFYNINDNNNKIDFYENLMNKTITLSNGSYNINNLITHIENLLNSISSGYAVYTVSYSSITFKLTISSTENFRLLFKSGLNSLTSPYKELGFVEEDGILPIDTNLDNITTSNNIVNLSLPMNLYVSINNWNGLNIQDTSGTYSSFVIPVIIKSGQIINFNGNDIEQFIEIPTNINIIYNLQININSINNKLINLNNSEWSIILELIN